MKFYVVTESVLALKLKLQGSTYFPNNFNPFSYN